MKTKLGRVIFFFVYSQALLDASRMKEMRLILAIAWLVVFFRYMSVTAELLALMTDFSSEVHHPRMDDALFTRKHVVYII